MDNRINLRKIIFFALIAKLQLFHSKVFSFLQYHLGDGEEKAEGQN